MVLRVGVEVEDADADADVLGEPRTMLETFGWIAYRVTVYSRRDAGRGGVAGCRGWANSSADEMAERANRADVLHLQLNVVARLVNDRRRNFVVELLMTMSDSKDSRDCR